MKRSGRTFVVLNTITVEPLLRPVFIKEYDFHQYLNRIGLLFGGRLPNEGSIDSLGQKRTQVGNVYKSDRLTALLLQFAGVERNRGIIQLPHLIHTYPVMCHRYSSTEFDDKTLKKSMPLGSPPDSYQVVL